jgi:mannose-6-phosphate isomerase-like protein (cupin superfamily)
MTAQAPGPFNLETTYLRLRNDASIEPLPVNAEFWPRLMTGALGTFHHEYLVTMYEYAADWPNWEMHPNGDEIVCLLEGHVTFVLERDALEQHLELAEPGAYVLVPRGTWHTAKTSTRCRMLFVTAGEGTQHRPA